MRSVVIKNDELHKKFKKIAVEKGLSMIQATEEALTDYLKKNERKGNV